MRPLVMGPPELERLAAVRKAAQDKPLRLEELRRRIDAREEIVAEDQRCEIPYGFRIAFTIEQHPRGWARHLSVSVPDDGRLPNSHAMQWIGRSLGMAMEIFDGGACETYFEPADGPPRAVNVVEPMREFTCGMCHQTFPIFDGDDEKAALEARVNGTDREPSGLVCDECYKLTPWGADAVRN